MFPRNNVEKCAIPIMHCALARPMAFSGVSCLTDNNNNYETTAQKKKKEEKKDFAVTCCLVFKLYCLRHTYHLASFGGAAFGVDCCILEMKRYMWFTSQVTKQPFPRPPDTTPSLFVSPFRRPHVYSLFYFFSCEASCYKVGTLLPRDGNTRTLPLTNAKQVRVAGNYALKLSLFDLLA